MNPYQPPESNVDAPAPPAPGIRIGAVARDVAILWTLTFLGGFVVGLAGETDPQRRLLAMAASNVILSTIGFVISGALARESRWRHLAIVAAAFWLTSLINLAFGVGLIQWLSSSFMVALTMAAGGGLSYIFSRAR